MWAVVSCCSGLLPTSLQPSRLQRFSGKGGFHTALRNLGVLGVQTGRAGTGRGQRHCPS